MVYSPTPWTVFLGWPSSKVIGESISIGTSGSPPWKLGLPICGTPWGPVLVASVPLGTTSFTTAWYLTVTGVPLASVRVNSSSGVSPLNCLSGVKVTVPSASTSNLPTFCTSFTVEWLSNNGVEPAGNGTESCPGVKVTLPSWTWPCRPSVLFPTPVGFTAVTVAWYFALAMVPLTSARLTSISGVLPTNVLTGVKVILPSISTSNLPTFSISFTLVPVSKTGGLSAEKPTSGLPASKVILPFWTNPCRPSVWSPVAFGITSSTVGVYLAVTSVPFASTRLTVTGVALPVNFFSGLKVMEPSELIV